MLYVLYSLFFIACIVLVGSVLLQPGKTDAGALFTSNISNSAFGPRGTASVLSKITIVAAACFMVLALFISMPVFQGGVSVLQTAGTDIPVEANTNTNTNANVSSNSNSESPIVSDSNSASGVNAVSANSNGEPSSNK